jgi:hypothetical protein
MFCDRHSNNYTHPVPVTTSAAHLGDMSENADILLIILLASALY